jgi:hypothetical protein
MGRAVAEIRDTGDRLHPQQHAGGDRRVGLVSPAAAIDVTTAAGGIRPTQGAATMGLDITAYRKIERIPDEKEGEYLVKHENGATLIYAYWVDEETLKWIEERWPGRTGGIKPGYYTAEEAFDFRAGSYSGYNWWRDRLARMAFGKPAESVWREDSDGPFFELIAIPDNEGVIGAPVAAKLARDFAEHADKAAAFAETLGAPWWPEVYADWRKAFEMGADGGAVDFH